MGLDGREGQSSHSLEERLPSQTETLLWFDAGSEYILPVWAGWGGLQGCGSCPLGGLVTLECVLCHLCRMWQPGWDGILGMAFPSPASSFPGAAEWSPSVMFTHPALKSLLTSLTTWKQDTGGFYLVKVLGTVERVRKERANTPQVSQPLLFVRLLAECK